VRKAVGIRPVIDLYKNADSAIEAAKEKEEIFKAISSGQLDTTGSNNGVYYKIIKEGDGEFVKLTDTLTVHYKGMLMNGYIFDQTKEKPAVFPLKRLIRGWQNGMVYCRQGGKIRLIIPSYLGYSIRNLAEIPANSVLIFDVEVVGIKR
jgi:FKBP-type peptidyl-prolyl cis-trans isomerase